MGKLWVPRQAFGLFFFKTTCVFPCASVSPFPGPNTPPPGFLVEKELPLGCEMFLTMGGLLLCWGTQFWWVSNGKEHPHPAFVWGPNLEKQLATHQKLLSSPLAVFICGFLPSLGGQLAPIVHLTPTWVPRPFLWRSDFWGLIPVSLCSPNPAQSRESEEGRRGGNSTPIWGPRLGDLASSSRPEDA